MKRICPAKFERKLHNWLLDGYSHIGFWGASWKQINFQIPIRNDEIERTSIRNDRKQLTNHSRFKIKIRISWCVLQVRSTNDKSANCAFTVEERKMINPDHKDGTSPPFNSSGWRRIWLRNRTTVAISDFWWWQAVLLT